MTKISFCHLYPRCKTLNMFGFTKGKNSDIQCGWTGGSNYGQESDIRCFVAKSVMSRVTRVMRGGSQKVTNDDEGEGGSRYPPNMMTSFMNSPLVLKVSILGQTRTFLFKFADLSIMTLGCGSLKTGTLLIGSLNLVVSILGILISTWCLTHSKVSSIISPKSKVSGFRIMISVSTSC